MPKYGHKYVTDSLTDKICLTVIVILLTAFTIMIYMD